MCQFDAELRLLRHEKLRLYWQLKLADLRQLMLYQELLLFKEFERGKDSLQEKLNGRIKEENSITVGDSLRTRGPVHLPSLRKPFQFRTEWKSPFRNFLSAFCEGDFLAQMTVKSSSCYILPSLS